ncbi:hypothetical protein Airi02_040110 [Actinoallomurus iriomotensis]|uniref:Uncharacterized protein n=1 Tax=Actinoallomurus iriomotensis TaxID=478107 RepID=A0A9W6S5G9_9ACTN|nr:hypothetical protein Airi02_040110 [Actinoallomurus iriomotensis]
MSDPLARKSRGSVGVTPTLVPAQSSRELTGHELTALTRHVPNPSVITQRKHRCRPAGGPADKIMFEHPPSTPRAQAAPKRTLGTPDSVENAQLSTGAPPGT